MQRGDVMASSKELSKLIGPTLSVMSLSEVLNFQIWSTNMPPVTYLNGVLLFIAGISIIRVHNFWVRSWRVAVTLTGWFCLAAGLFRMFFPQARQAGNTIPTYMMLTTLFATGLFLTIKAFGRSKTF
jgi:hypothetical protein